MKGFVKVASAIPKVKVADCRYNIVEINRLIQEAATSEVQIVVFPELSITGYTCGDLFFSADASGKCFTGNVGDCRTYCTSGYNFNSLTSYCYWPSTVECSRSYTERPYLRLGSQKLLA